MKFSFEWLKELITFQESPEKLAELLTLHLAETNVSFRGKRVILDIDLLPNRIADVSGHLGLAREIGAILGKKFNYPVIKLKEDKQNTKKFLKVSLQSNFCKRYVARVLVNVKVGPSPLWLKERLEDCGLRSINNVVDATNYVMLLTGQPLHAFDFEKIALNQDKTKEIIVRQAKKGEQIITLDRKTYNLTEDNLLICDVEKPLALAGIKGGVAAEIDENTHSLVLESANFEGANIRLTSKTLGLKTDASLRFEHQLHPDLTIYAIDILAQLIQQLAGGIILKGKVDVKNYPLTKKNIIPIAFSNLERFLGWPFSKKEIIQNLKLLGFETITRKEYLLVSPPLYRNDIETKEDVMGEVARIYGFYKLPGIPPKEEIKLPAKNEFWEFKEKIKDWLKEYRLEEVYNYSFISQKDKDILNQEWQNKLISLVNPLSDLFAYLRPTLLFTFLKNLKNNFRFVDTLRLFEIGNIYFYDTKTIKEKEETVFGGILGRKEKSLRQPLFYEAKGILEELFNKLGIDKNDYTVKLADNTEYSCFFDKGVAIYHKNQCLGVLGQVKNDILKLYDLEGEIVFWEIKLLNLFDLENEEKEYEPLPQYPAAIRDISFIIKKDILIDEILNTIQKTSSYLEDVDLFDIYDGDKVPLGEQSLSFHLIFRASNKTLTAEEVEQELQKIIKALNKLGAKIR